MNELPNVPTNCARHGIATTTIDMLICAVAIGRGVPILTIDGDFARYANGCQSTCTRSLETRGRESSRHLLEDPTSS